MEYLTDFPEPNFYVPKELNKIEKRIEDWRLKYKIGVLGQTFRLSDDPKAIEQLVHQECIDNLYLLFKKKNRLELFKKHVMLKIKMKRIERNMEIMDCPGCGVLTMKISGNDHISCPCGTHWCYKCGDVALTTGFLFHDGGCLE